MAQLSDTELEELAREVACKFIGADKVHKIKFEPGIAWTEEPLYYFWYQIDEDPDRAKAAHQRIGFALALRDALIARGDDTIPHPQVIDADRWDERWGV